MNTEVLNHDQIEKKISRIAHQILEKHHKAEQLILIGVKGGGYAFAKKLHARLKSVAPNDFKLIKIIVNKKDPSQDEISLSEDIDLNGKPLILVDDVANTGSTMFYAMKPLLDFKPKSVGIAVLVDRMHKRYPISSDYVGLQLATTMQEHIKVNLKGKEMSAWLS